ncbi:MAG: ATP-binding protein, partial [Solirubrobacteraceae bacterium]
MDQFAPGRPAALLEREHEVERIRDLLRAVGRRSGSVLVIEAVAGMGKSMLIEVARARASELGIRVLNARATDLEQGFPFGVMRQLFERPLLEATPDERDRWLAGAAALAADVLANSPAAPSRSSAPSPSPSDPGYAWQHGLYWLASNLSGDSPLALVVDDLQWIDRPSARALAFIARRLEGQPLTLIIATRPLDPALTPVSASLVADPGIELLRPSPLTAAAIRALIVAHLSLEPDERFVSACMEVTRGNPFLLGELLDEVSVRGMEPTAAAASDVGAIVPRGVANTVLIRLARLPPSVAALARALSVLGDAAQVGDATRLAELQDAETEAALPALVSAAVVRSGSTIRFTHPMLRTAIYRDLSPAERERLHQRAATILRERGAPVSQVAAHVAHTEPGGNPEAVALLRNAARDALELGDAVAAAALLARALDEPPTDDARLSVLLELGQSLARAGAPDAVAPLSEVIAHDEDADAIVAAAIELSGLLFFAGHASEGAAVLRRAQGRLAASESARERLDVALLGGSYTSASVRRDTDATIAKLRDPGGPARGMLQATTLATLAMDEVMYLGSASKAIDLAERALAAGLPPDPHRGENWVILALAALSASDAVDAALRGTDAILAQARERGAAMTVVSMLSLKAGIAVRCGDVTSAWADAEAAIELAPELLGAEYLVLAVSAAVFAGLDRGETPESLRRLIDRAGVRYDTEFLPGSQLRFASGLLRAAAGDHEAAIEELGGCELDHPTFGGENPAVLAWRSAAALSLSELGRHDEARVLAADEVKRALAFGAPRAIGVALRTQALVGPSAQRSEGLAAALAVLAPSQARLEHARVLIDLGATLRAVGQRAAAREPLLKALALAARCGASAVERRARTELAAIGVRPRTSEV